MDNSQLSEQISKKYASLKRHEANVERLLNKEPFTEFDNKKLHREKYMVRKLRKAISDIEEHLKNKNMLTEDYVSFETAKLLKEKGFAETSNTIGTYNNKGEFFLYGHENGYNHNRLSTWYSAPTLQMALKWLRKKGFHIFVPMEIDYDEDERGDKWYHNATYYPEIRRVSDGKIMYDDGSLYAEPEHAYEVAIKYCLENLI